MHPLLADQPATRLLLGNEAIVRGALEAGVGFVSTYPGTPASEIGDSFFRLHEEAGVTFEYSINEKVALEVAGAAAVSGVRSLVAMKHVGVNVAADPLMTLAYTGVRGGLVLVSADDPGCHSSQNEQDNRHYARLGKIPLLEPATPEQAYQLVQEAFALSERHQTPVILRTTTRVSHTRAPITLGSWRRQESRGDFVADKRRFMPVPAVAKLRHPVVEETLKSVEAEFETSPLNVAWGSGRLGILTSGVSACYVEDVVRRLNLLDRVRVLHLATIYPAPRKLLADFVRAVDHALVVEELDPVLENELRGACVRAERLIPIYGKESGHFSLLGELGPDQVADALADVLQIELDRPATPEVPPLPPRPPILCPGCPHRATYYAVKLAAGDDALYVSDIGCYTLGFAPPINMGDFFICMGSSASSAGGFAAATDRRIISFIGDSTFFHSGITGLINSVHQGRDLTLVVLDNGTTGMTGHQPHPGTSGAEGTSVDIEALARAAGVRHVATIDPANFKQSMSAIRQLLDQPGPKVLISRSPCPLLVKKTTGKKTEAVRYAVDYEKCMFCRRKDSCLYCGIDPFRDYSLARGRARVEAGPDEAARFAAEAPVKMETPPCEAACPLGLCVQGYVTAVAARDLPRARSIIRQRLVLPHTICRVCPHPCEDVCVRRDIDESIAINGLKRFVMDSETDEDRWAYVEHASSLIKSKGKKVAVIGAGPAGLSCAFDLRLRGYEVTVFEAEEAAGGMAHYGIPRHRLPREALQKDIDVIAGLGVEFRFGVRFGRDISTTQLKKQGFAAVFVSPGMTGGLRLGVSGDNLPGVVDAMSWLRRVNVEGLSNAPARVMVVGGGNAAIDAARCALRLGAHEVTLLYRRTRAEMPAIKEEIDAALAEGVRLVELAAPDKIAKNGAGLSVMCRRMRLGDPGADGRRKPEPTEDTFDLEGDLLISAIGQQSDLPGDAMPEVLRDRWGRLIAHRATGATDDPFVYAGGDAVTGPATVVEALQSGKFAAYGIDLALSDDRRLVVAEMPQDREALLSEPRFQPTAVIARPRRHPPRLEAKEAARTFDEAEQGFSIEQAVAEANRCLACGLCASCDNCLQNFGCPAFFREGGKVQIDPILCDGCGLCVQVCPNGAIVPVAGGDAT